MPVIQDGADTILSSNSTKDKGKVYFGEDKTVYFDEDANLWGTGQDVPLGETQDVTAGPQRRSDAGAGRSYTLRAGGPKALETDTAGGTAVLSGGISTGSAGSAASIKTAKPASTGTADNTPTESVGVDALGNVSLGLGTGQLAQNATTGFPFAPTVATGAPSGTPTVKTGLFPFTFSRVTAMFYAHDLTSWIKFPGISAILDYIVNIGRNTAAGAGKDIQLTAGGAKSGETDTAGGDVEITSGISTGAAGSKFNVSTAKVAGAGTTDRTPTKSIEVDDKGNVQLGVAAQLAQNATDGFAYAPTIATGVPSGTPTGITGQFPFTLSRVLGAIFAHDTSIWLKFPGVSAVLDYIVSIGRNTAAGAGKALQLVAGGAKSGETDTAGGAASLSGGIGTGTGGSTVSLLTAKGGSTGTSDNTPTESVGVDDKGNVKLGAAQVAQGATDGFIYIPTCATGAPNGTPTAKSGFVPMTFNGTTLYIYASGAWKAYSAD